MAGWGRSPLTFTANQGGNVVLQAQIIGGRGTLRVEASMLSSHPILGAARVVFATFSGRDANGIHTAEFRDIPPHSLPAGEFTIEGLQITATDATGAVATWPQLNVPAEPLELLAP